MIQKLSNDTDFAEVLKKIGVDAAGQKILNKKNRINYFFIPSLDIRAANILKQDALSIGADLAVSKQVAAMSVKNSDALLVCSDSQLEKLIKKEALQPFGLKKISEILKQFLHSGCVSQKPKIMGILNINEDSFFKNSRIDEESFVDAFTSMCEDGADIIDIGAVSSRPGSEYPGVDEELRRISPILRLIKKHSLYKKAKISIDTYEPKVARAALEAGCHIINDITGLSSSELAAVVAEYNASIVIMHMRGTPKNMQTLTDYDNLFFELDDYFRQKLEIAHSFGIKEVILDVGIGFAKLLEHNLALIKHLSHFKAHGKPLLVGASRKSMINSVSPSSPEERLAGTLALHQKALDEGASIIRCHDVKEHLQMLRIWQALKNTTI
jgi:dihydropteroate synthase